MSAEAKEATTTAEFGKSGETTDIKSCIMADGESSKSSKKSLRFSDSTLESPQKILGAMGRLHNDLRDLILHHEGWISDGLGKLSKQQDRLADFWAMRCQRLESQMERLLEEQEHTPRTTPRTTPRSPRRSPRDPIKQGVGRAPLGPISMWEPAKAPMACSKPPEPPSESDLPTPTSISGPDGNQLLCEPAMVASGLHTSHSKDTEEHPGAHAFERSRFSQSALSFGPCIYEEIESYGRGFRQSTAGLSADSQSTSATVLFSRDAHLHWRRMIRKEFNKKQFDEPLSDRSRRDMMHNLTFFQRVVRSRAYEVGSLVLVLLNAVFIGWQVEYLAINQIIPSSQKAGEIAFCTLFSLELMVRFAASGLGLFFTPEWGWHFFDILVVTMMLAEFVLDAVAESLSSGMLSQMSALRVLRLVRVVRVLKVIRVLKFFRELRMMVYSILSSFKSLAWAIMVQGVMFYIFGISLTQGVVDYLSSTSSWSSLQTLIMREKFGTLGRSCLSLFEAMAGGISWGELIDAIEPLNEGYKLIFLVYISFAIFAVANIVTAVFVEGAMLNAQHDREVVIQEQMRTNQAYLQSMQQIFYEVDRDEDGSIELEELRQAMKDERVVAYMSAFGLDITEVNTLFLLLDRDQTGKIDIDDFLLGCMRLKGGAKTLDVAKVQYDCEWMVHNLESLTANMADVMDILKPRK